MATITSTIRLVDQMTPTLNKISKAIDRVNTQTNKLGSARTWNGFNTGVRTATKSTHNLYNALRRVVFTLGVLRGLQGLVTISDTMMNATARLGNLTENAAETAYYMDAIYAAAQRSRGEFMSMANSVGKLGTVAGHAFGSVEEMIAFTELMNKLFVISGSSAAEASNAMYQLTQAMAAGRLQGDEMRSILENAPMLAQRIADYMGVSIGEVKQLGAEGVITADIIKAALFGAADDIEERYSEMPKTIGQIWTQIKNHALNAFRPVIDRVQQFINSPMFEKFQNKIYDIITGIANKVILFFDLLETPRVQKAIQAICNAFAVLWEVVSWVGQAVVNVAIWICDNWSWIGDIVFAVIAAMLLYKAVVLAVQAACVIANIANGVSAWASALMAGQAWAWVILIIVALIAIIYLGVAAWNHFTGQSVSATGVLLGCIGYAIAFIVSMIQVIWALAVTVVGGLIAIGAITVAAISAGIVAIIEFFKTLWETGKAVGNSLSHGFSQVGTNIGIIWDNVKAWCVGAWWSMVSGAIDAMNSLVSGADSGCTAIANFFIRIANKAIDAFNWIVSGWNNTIGRLSGASITNPFTGTKYQIIGDITFGEAGHIGEISSMGWKGIENTASGKAGSAFGKIRSLNSVDWNWGNVGTAWNSGIDNLVTATKDMWNNASIGGVNLKDLAGNSWQYIKDTWTADLWMDPNKTYESWSKKGEAFENGVGDVVDGIGAILSGLSGGNLSDTLAGNGKLPFTPDGSVPESMEDLLGGYGGSGSPNDLLGTIADNTGRGAGSAANIDDTLDLAEDELELLRKIAEKEVVNRFTTAEIKVDMTNNNNVSSNMDLDGIVTHLSTKLYEELGVVASGVHY